MEAARMDRAQKILRFALAGQKIIDRAMGCPGIAARADFDGLHAKFCKVVERFFESFGAENDGKYAYFHSGAATVERGAGW